jgi:3-phenylpropionate/trans-cinnamate dioxygenase ferredoxin subunit
MAENFVALASVADVPAGKMYRAEHGGNNYLLANVEGTIYAVDDLCTHEDASLYKGSLHGDCVKCPLHGSRFDLKTGAALDEPAEEDLNTYAVKIEGDSILVAVI